MIEDIDIYRSAKIFISQHGPDAYDKACDRASELQSQGDALGSAVWHRIAKAVEWFQSTSAAADKQTH